MFCTCDPGSINNPKSGPPHVPYFSVGVLSKFWLVTTMYSSRKGLTVEGTMQNLVGSVADISDTESNVSEMAYTNLPTKSVWKSSQSHLWDSYDSELSSTDRSDSEVCEQSNTETVNGWSKSDQTPNIERFLWNSCMIVDIDDPSDVTQVVSTVIEDDIIQLFAEQSNL
jgi:hypothetical protein